MEDLNDKVTGGTLTADEWNQIPSELQNIIQNSGIVLTSTDVGQAVQSIYNIGRRANKFTDTGTANTYVVANDFGQPSTYLVAGMRVEFDANVANTGASTINVDGLGAKQIVKEYGSSTALSGGEMYGFMSLVYDGTRFSIVVSGEIINASNAVYDNNTYVQFRNVENTSNLNTFGVTSSNDVVVKSDNDNVNITANSVSGTATIQGKNITANAAGGTLNLQGSDVNITANGAGDVIRVRGGNVYIQVGSGNDPSVTCNAGAAVSLYYNGSASLRTVDRTSGSFTTGAGVYDSLGTYYDVGYNVMPVVTTSSSLSLGKNYAGKQIYFSGSSAGVSITVSGDSTNPIGTTWVIFNMATQPLTISAGSETLAFFDGSGTLTYGNKTLAVGGVCTITKRSPNNYSLFGAGIS